MILRSTKVEYLPRRKALRKAQARAAAAMMSPRAGEVLITRYMLRADIGVVSNSLHSRIQLFALTPSSNTLHPSAAPALNGSTHYADCSPPPDHNPAGYGFHR